MKKRALLLVEDNADDEEMTIRALKGGNLANEIVVARDGAEAVELLVGQGCTAETLPAVVLLDLHLPKVSGLEVLRRMRADERTRIIPVVVLTSSADDEDRVASYELGCNSFVRKPVGFAAFGEAVRQLGLYWLLLNEPPVGRRDGR